MSKFTDYEASAITPQYTLLKKLNAILEYLREEPVFFLHKCSFKFSGLVNNFVVYFVSNSKEPFVFTESAGPGRLKVKGLLSYRLSSNSYFLSASNYNNPDELILGLHPMNNIGSPLSVSSFLGDEVSTL